MVQRYSFLKNIQREMAIRSSTRYLTKEEKEIKLLFKRPEYADEWLKLRRKVMSECEDVLQECIPLLQDSYPDLIINIARNIVRLTWPFSASETHHHPHMGGLPLHLCETMLEAIKLFKISNTSKSLAVEASKGKTVDFMKSDNIYKKAVFSLCLASLAHDIGKVYDQQLSSKQPGLKYYPLTTTPEIWLAERNLSIEHVNLRWLPERHRSCHAIAGLGVLQNLLSPLMSRPDYADIMGAFSGDHLLIPDPSSNEIPLNNLSKVGTYLHLTNLAILHHNNMEYGEDEDNFVLEILRQADADSSIEWSQKVVTSFTDFFKSYLKQEIGQSININDKAFLTVYARKNSRFVLIPIKRLHEGFTLYINSFGKDFTIDVKGMRFELVRCGYSPRRKKGELEALIVEITSPEIVRGVVETIMIDTSKINMKFNPKKPDLGIHLQRSNMKGNDTLGNFYFTPPIVERAKKRDLTGSKKSAEKITLKEKTKSKVDDFSAFLENDTVSIDTSKEDNVVHGDEQKGESRSEIKKINVSNVRKKKDLSLSDIDSSEAESLPNIIDKIEDWVEKGKIKVNDFSTALFVIAPENMPEFMFIKVRDPILLDSDFVDYYVKDFVKLTDKHWGEEYLIYSGSYSVKGSKGGANGDYLIKCPIVPNVAKQVSLKKQVTVTLGVVCTSLNIILNYCDLPEL